MADQIFSTIETEYNSQKTETIQGQAGKQIKITKVNLSMFTTQKGVAGSVKVTTTVNGTEKLLAEFTEDAATDFTPKSVDTAFLAATGADVTLKWYLKTETEGIRIKAQSMVCTSSLVDIPVEDNATYMLSVKGLSKNTAGSLATELKSKYSDVKIFVEQ